MSVSLFFAFPGVPHVKAVFLQRDTVSDSPYAGGNISYEVGDDPLRVTEERETILARHAADGLRILTDVHQVHGDRLLFDPQAQCSCEDCDGLATRQKGQGLLIKTADCQPVLLTDRAGSAVLALHIGWRGNRNGFIESAIAAFCTRYALKACDLLAVRGPSLGPAKAEFIHFDLEWGPEFAPWFDRKSQCMDLWAITRWQLTRAGLPEKSIFGLDLCTESNPSFFSFRRKKVCGRQGGLIWIA
ncbi:MAG: laccase domain-containing protein [Desulfovibrionaceae bacterium]|nr:laccase domain-containing protein [Desulfovibrionaceae bacterium]